MALKKIQLSVSSVEKPIDPIEIFKKLTLRGSIGNIWEPQADALKEWHKNRNDSDIVIQMNTGGGKTLVGLLMAQSLVNETKGSVLYVSPNNQLVEQIVAHAKEMGLSPATRYKGAWNNREEFELGNTFCVTNYATLFNGKSIFRNEDIDALVFDDAHVAENVIRGQFTLRILRDNRAFDGIIHLFRKHFANSGQADRYDDIANGRFTRVLFIPMFIVWENVQELRMKLIEAGIDSDEQTLFAWEHLRDHLSHCTILADSNGLEITAAVIPLSQLNYFQEGVRRVYMTATLPSMASFVRTFGVATPTIVQPSGKSGEAQRLFVFVQGKDEQGQRNEAISMVKNHKCCVISPSNIKAQEWVPPARIYDTDAGQIGIDRFCESQDAEMLALVARYDGIDLPGDACKMLILDSLPTGENLINRFIDEYVRVEMIRISNTATRVVQAIGRIFRSNTDHGVVLLVGPKLQAWVRSPKNRAYLPLLIQKQLLLSTELLKQVEAREVTWEDLIEGVLTGDRNWDDMYNQHIDQFDTSKSSLATEWHIKLIIKEKIAYEQLWQRQYQQAASTYATLADDAWEYDPNLSAWYRHWRGLALMCADDKQGAFQEFIVAANRRSELGRPSEERERSFKQQQPDVINQQARNLADKYRTRRTQITKSIKQAEKDLCYGSETNKAEEACRILGDLIGLSTDRPDKSTGTGPDVTWEGIGCPSIVGFELKTDKKKEGEYFKKDISGCHDHEQWLIDRHSGEYELIIIGPTIPVSKKASPSTTLKIVEIDAMRDLLTRARKMFEAVESGDKTNLAEIFQNWLDYFGLNWPDCILSLGSSLAVDLKDD